VETIRVLRVARRGALKARVLAGEQLHGLVTTAPEELAAPRRRLTTTRQLAGACVGLRPGPLRDPVAATKHALRVIARRRQQLQAELDALDAELATLIGQVAPRLLSLPGSAWTPPGSRWSPPATTPAAAQRGGVRAPVRGGADPGLLGSHRPPPAQPRRRPTRQQRAVADRPGPDALPRPDQGIRPAADQAGLVQRCLKRYVAREVYGPLISAAADHQLACQK
jgi:transposase